jgi:hypothetical protein
MGAPCVECGAMQRPKSVRFPDTCVRCADGEGIAAAPASAGRVSLIGIYDSPDIVLEGVVLAEEWLARRRAKSRRTT